MEHGVWADIGVLQHEEHEDTKKGILLISRSGSKDIRVSVLHFLDILCALRVLQFLAAVISRIDGSFAIAPGREVIVLDLIVASEQEEHAWENRVHVSWKPRKLVDNIKSIQHGF
jgi:hypothetical protein